MHALYIAPLIYIYSMIVGCPAHCEVCKDDNGDDSTECSDCDDFYYLNNGECNSEYMYPASQCRRYTPISVSICNQIVNITYINLSL